MISHRTQAMLESLRIDPVDYSDLDYSHLDIPRTTTTTTRKVARNGR